MGQTADWVDPYRRDDNSTDGAGTDANMMSGFTPSAADIDAESEETSEADVIAGADEIRAGIEQTRSEMAETINAIQEKLSPQNLVDQAKDSIREATVGRVEQMISNVGDNVGEMAGQAQDTAGGILNTIKENPIPAALAGVGLAWLFMKGNDGSSGGSHGYNGQQARLSLPQYPSPVYPGYQSLGSDYKGGSQSNGGILNTIKQNPIPFGLAGAALWSLMNKGQSSSSGSQSQYRPQGPGYQQYGSQNTGYQGYGAYPSQVSNGDTIGDKIGDVASGAGEKVGQVAGDARDKVGDVAGQAVETVGQVAGAVGETVGQVAGTVGHAVGNVAGAVGSTAGNAVGAVGGTTGDILDLIRRNPVQSALAGLSIGWLFLNGRDGSRSGDKIVHGAQSAVGDTIGNVGGAIGDVAGGAGGKVGEFAGNAQSQVQKSLMENPLVVGAAAMALGAAVGLVIPETPQEHKIMGQARDTLMEKAQGVAQDTMQKVQRVAEEVTDTVKETVQTQAESQGLIGSTA